MCVSKVKQFQLIEIPVTATAGTKVMIPDQPQLRIQRDQKIYVQVIELFTDAVAPVSPTGTINATNAELAKMCLVVYSKGEERIYQIPVFRLNRINDGTSPFVYELPEFDDMEIDFAKSYLQFSSAPVGPYNVLLGVTYQRKLG